MTPADPAKAEAIFAAAMDIPSARRGAFLRERCGGDEQLFREIESLLAHHDAGEGFLEEPATVALSGGTPAAAGAALQVPERVGRYRILSILGEGGMGTVYRAEQDSPRRAVALKVLRVDCGLAGSSAVRRFQQEGVVLGRLQHPGIAQVFETGTDPQTGRAFLAMELIQGRLLTEYCRLLPVRARLELVAEICEAVHHAHQRGVIHRDLKPGNIIVDETGHPKVLDFGVAALLNPHAQATMHTRTGELIGTIAYMSPEQIGGETDSVDTRGDIYSLGVILFEVLAGRLPHDVRRKPLPEAIRLVRESDPTRLSTLAREFRGDLDTIVGKALERDPARRYSSAAELGADIRRHLADEPIAARPPNAAYQVGKFARRHKVIVGAGAVVVLTLIIALVSVSLSLVQARVAAAAARSEAQRAATVSEFLRTLITGVDPGIARGKDPELLMSMIAGAERRVGELAGNPRAEVEVRSAIGQAYITISRYREAEAQLSKAVQVARTDLPPGHPDLYNALQLLGSVYDRMDRPDDSVRATQEALEGWTRLYGSDSPRALLAMNNHGKNLADRGRYGEAETILRRALEGQRRVLGEDDPDTLRTMSNLASLLSATKRFADAEPMFRDVIDRRVRVLGEDHPDTLTIIGNLGSELLSRDRREEAEPLLVKALEIRRRVMGDDHMETLVSMYNLASLYFETQRSEPAAELAESLAQRAPKVLGDQHALTAAAFHMLGKVRRSQKRFDEALAAQQGALAACQKSLPPEHPRHGIFRCTIGRTLIDLERFAEAETMLLAGREILVAASGPSDAATLTADEMLVSLYKAWDKPEELRRWTEELETARAGAKP